jgi:hypothetical protein
MRGTVEKFIEDAVALELIKQQDKQFSVRGDLVVDKARNLLVISS